MFGSGWSWSRRSAFGECSWFVLVIRQWVVGFLLLLLLGLGCCCCCGGGGGGSSCRPRQAGSGGASPLPLEVLNCCWRRLYRRLSSLCLDSSWRHCSSWRRRSSSCRHSMLRRSTLRCRRSMSCRRRLLAGGHCRSAVGAPVALTLWLRPAPPVLVFPAGGSIPLSPPAPACPPVVLVPVVVVLVGVPGAPVS